MRAATSNSLAAVMRSDDDDGEAEAGGIGDDARHDGSHGKADVAPKALKRRWR